MNTHVTVKIGGEAHGLQFRSVEIKQSLFEPCQIQVELGFKSPEANSVYDKAASSWLGSDLVVTFGDKDDNSMEKKYQGTIVSLSLGTEALTLSAKSEDHLMTVARKHKAFVSMPVSDMVNDVVRANVKDSSITNPDRSLKFTFLQQYEETDASFLKRLAWYDGCVFFHDGEKFVYTSGMGGGKSVSLELGHLSDVRMICSLVSTNGVERRTISRNTRIRRTTPWIQEDTPRLLIRSPQGLIDKAQQVYKSPVEEIYNEAVTNNTQFESFLTHQQSLAGGKLVKVTGKTNHPMVAIGRTIQCKDHPILKDQVVVTNVVTTFKDIVYTSAFEAVSEETVLMESEPGVGTTSCCSRL